MEVVARIPEGPDCRCIGGSVGLKVVTNQPNAKPGSCLEEERPSAPWRVCYRIGEVSLGLSSSGDFHPHVDSQFDLFRANDLLDGDAACDIEIAFQWADELLPPAGKLLFDSGSVWKLYDGLAGDGGMVFDFASSAIGPDPYKRLHVDRDFRHALLLVNRSYFSEGSDCNLLEYPLDELAVMHRLGRERGVEVHAAGLYDADLRVVGRGGFLFIGHSGAGKSTTTRLWRERHNVTILSDDRIILRKHEGQVWMHGTPWHGEAAFAAAEKCKIDRLFILEHAPANRITQLRGSQAVGELMARSFLPFYDGPSLESTMAFLEEIVETIPCYRLEFLPDASAVEAVLSFGP